MYENPEGIQTWQETAKAPEAVLGRSDNGTKVQGVLWPPI